MYPDSNRIAEIHKQSINTFGALTRAVIDATEKLAQLNLSTGRALLNDATVAAQRVSGIKDAQELATAVTQSGQPSFDRVGGYARQVYDIVGGVGAEWTKAVEAGVEAGKRQFADVVDTVAKNAPAGSESAVAWFKSAAATAESAFDAMNRAAKQNFEATQSSIAAATSANSAAFTRATKVA